MRQPDFPEFDTEAYVTDGDLSRVSQWVANVVAHYANRPDLTPEERGAARAARGVVMDVTGMAWARMHDAAQEAAQ